MQLDRRGRVSPVVTPGKLVPVLRRLQRRGRRIVFTNGVFDLLHRGHLALLEKARRLGDVLVVGINSDASTRRLKGSNRPLVRARDRAALLAGLRSVDFVTIFNEDTPLALIRTLRPDVLVKGADYKLSQIKGRGLVKCAVRIPLVPGRSTSRLIRKIRGA